MTEINSKITREQLASIVVRKLKEHKIEAVLVGGSVVSIYTKNQYESNDLDFISSADHKRIVSAMQELGFTTSGKDFAHALTKFTVEFPSGPLAIGDDEPVKAEGAMVIDGVNVTMLSPTQSVMDRLAWFFHSNDRQCLDQALWIAQQQPVNMDKVRAWAERERHSEKFNIFLNRLKPQS